MKQIIAIMVFTLFCNVLLIAEENSEYTVVVGVYDNPPKIFKKPDGSIGGFHAELIQEIAKKHNWNLHYRYGEWNQLLSLLEKGEIDVMVDIAYSQERSKIYDFNKTTVFINWASIYTRGSFLPKNILDLDGKKVAGLEGGIHISGPGGIRKLAESFKISVDIVEVPDYRSAFELLESATVDAAVVNRIFGAEHDSKYRVKRSPIVFNPISLRFAFPKGTPKSAYLIDIFDDELIQMQSKSNSLYYHLTDKYLPGYNRRQNVVPVWVYYFIPSALAVITCLFIFILLLKREISKRGIVEKKLIQAKNEAESANQAKSFFLASMSHEIRTPLNAIIGFSQILMKDKTLGGGHRNSLSSIAKSGIHLLELINDILDMSKIEVDKVVLHPSSFDMHQLVEEIMLIFQAQFKGKGLYFKKSISDSTPQYIVGDMQRVRQVILNLVGNALKFTERGGVTVCVEAIESLVTVSVVDTGRGILPDEQSRIFMPFEQGNTSVKTTEGTGLGLALSRRLARLMGGDVHCAESSSKGSAFVFTFTYTASKKELSCSQEPGECELLLSDEDRGKSVLVVDDKEENRTVARLLLESAGFKVTEAESGKEALHSLESEMPEIILMDVVMPDLGGNEVIKEIRQKKGVVQPTIIALSASVLEEDERESIQSGAQSFLRKPYLECQLLEEIEEHSAIKLVRRSLVQPKSDDLEDEFAKLVLSDTQKKEIHRAAAIGDLATLQYYSDEIAKRSENAGKYFMRLIDDFDLEKIKKLV